MEDYLMLFEQAIKAQAEVMGKETARKQAKKAGLGVGPSGSIVSCAGNPMVVLLRLIKAFTETGSLEALDACAPLISKMTKLSSKFEKVES